MIARWIRLAYINRIDVLIRTVALSPLTRIPLKMCLEMI